jgi:hypothetical protein
MSSAQSPERPDDSQGRYWTTLEVEQMVQWLEEFHHLQWSQIFVLFILRLKLQSPLHRRRRQVIAGICVEDKLKDTGSNEELLDLANNDRL